MILTGAKSSMKMFSTILTGLTEPWNLHSQFKILCWHGLTIRQDPPMATCHTMLRPITEMNEIMGQHHTWVKVRGCDGLEPALMSQDLITGSKRIDWSIAEISPNRRTRIGETAQDVMNPEVITFQVDPLQFPPEILPRPPHCGES